MRSALVRSTMLLVLASALSACAARPSSSKVAPAARRDVLTQEDLLNRGFTTALDAIQSLRSYWLETHGTNSFYTPTTVKVYLDDVQAAVRVRVLLIHHEELHAFAGVQVHAIPVDLAGFGDRGADGAE